MDRSKPLDLLATTARSGLHQGLRVGRIVVRRAGQAAATGATKARDAVEDYRSRRRPSAPLEAFVPSPRKPSSPPSQREAETETEAQTAEHPATAGPSPADVAKRVARKPPAKGTAKAPATKAASKPVKKSVPGAKLPPRRREEPATGE